MIDANSLDRAVREVTTSFDRINADRGLWVYGLNRPLVYALAPKIRARYREIVAQTDKP
jgi:hypothetical protein